MKAPPYAIGKIAFGAPGKPVMVGSLFYKGDRKVKDHKKGDVDCTKLKKEMKTVCSLGKKVGLDRAVDVIAESPQAMESYISLLAEMTEDPLLIGGMNEESRVAGYRKAKELGTIVCFRRATGRKIRVTSGTTLNTSPSMRIRIFPRVPGAISWR